jgi:hypothetical protein
MKKNKLPLRDHQLITTAFENNIDAFKSMMESCYAYDGLTRHNRYILEFRKELGDDAWNEVYEEYSKFLRNNYIVDRNIGRDSDGITYNRLLPKIDNSNQNT